MAKASRSKKSHPAFDPSELDDLLYSPAVGNGVPAHLIGPYSPPPNAHDLSGQMTRVDETRGEETRVDNDSAAVEPGSDEMRVTEETGVPTSNDAYNETRVYCPYSRQPQIREAITVQDGHTFAEQAIYEAMWREAVPISADERRITIGIGRLADLARISYKHCKFNARSLADKLAIVEHPGVNFRDGFTYTVYSPEKILRRRQDAGLTHVVRSRSVIFVDPRTREEKSLRRNQLLRVSPAEARR